MLYGNAELHIGELYRMMAKPDVARFVSTITVNLVKSCNGKKGNIELLNDDKGLPKYYRMSSSSEKLGLYLGTYTNLDNSKMHAREFDVFLIDGDRLVGFNGFREYFNMRKLSHD